MEESSHGQPGSIYQASLVAGDSFLLNAPPSSEKKKKKKQGLAKFKLASEVEAQAHTLHVHILLRFYFM